MKPKEKILVVDDDVSIRSILKHKLQKHFIVILAADGEEGLLLARREKPDLIISDVIMPKMNGLEFKEKIKAEPELHLVPFLFLSARGKETERFHGLMTGADDYLVKPFNIKLVLKRIRMLIDRSRVYREDSLALFSKEINSAFVPDELPLLEGFELFCKIKPAKLGGGDFIDIIKIDDSNYMFLQGDVMGKGVKAKFFAYAFAGYFRGIIHSSLSSKHMYTPAQLVNKFSGMVDNDPFLQDIFVTFFVFNLNLKSSTLCYCNAGFVPGILWQKDKNKFIELSEGGGIPGFYTEPYQEETIELQPENSLIICSDGIIEAKDVNGNMLGYEKLKERIRSLNGTKADDYGETIYKLALSHSKNALQYDDLSITVLKKA